MKLNVNEDNTKRKIEELKKDNEMKDYQNLNLKTKQKKHKYFTTEIQVGSSHKNKEAV